LGCAPAERIGADRAAMLTLPPVPPPTGWEMSLRLPRDHYVRLDSNDYSVHPTAVARRVLVRADLDRVRVWCEGDVVADHERVWAKHQTLSDPAHVKAAQLLRQQRFTLIPPATETEVEQRSLIDYDTALGVAGFDEEVAR
jgi:transposase